MIDSMKKLPVVLEVLLLPESGGRHCVALFVYGHPKRADYLYTS